MIRFLFAILATLMISSPSFAQAVQNGVVKEYNEKAKKTPLAGVELNVRSANSTVSDNNGEFSLNFLTLKAGEKINVRRIEKLGYEIFNKEAIEQWNLNPTTPFLIVMCKSDKFKKIRDNYEKVSSESYARQLKKEEASLAKLKADGKLKEEEYQKQLFELRENYEKQLDNLENYIDRFSRIDLSELSAIEQEIIELVQQGKIEDAIAKYEEQNYVDKYIREVSELKEVSKAINQLSVVQENKMQSRDSILSAINRQIETLRIAGGKENFDKIEQLLHDVAFADTLDIDQMVIYSRYIMSQNKHDKAIAALEIIKRARDLDGKDNNSFSKCIVVRRNIGNVYFSKGDFNNAERYYLEAIRICKEHNWTDDKYPEAHLEYCEAELGRLYSATKDFEKSEELLLSTFDRKFNKYNSEKNDHIIYELANVCRELSAFFSKKQDFSKAIEYGLKALNYYDEITDTDDEEYVSSYANISSDVAVAYYYVSDIDSAIKYAIVSLESRQKLYDFNPDKYGLNLAMSYGNLGNMYSMAGNKEKSFENAMSCHKILSQLNSIDPKAYANEYSMATYNLATEYIARNEYNKGLSCLLSILPTLQELYDEYSNAYSKFYIETLHTIALCEHNIEDYEHCNSHLDQAIVIINQANDEHRNIFLEPILNITVLKGDTYKKTGKLKLAKDSYLQAIEHSDKIGEINPTAFLASRLSAHFNLALLHKENKEIDEAIKILTLAKEKFGKFEIPQNEIVLYNLAEVYHSNGHDDKALETVIEGLSKFPQSEGLLHLKEVIDGSV